MIVDFHTHIFPPDLIARRDELLRRDVTFGNLYASPRARLATADDLLSSMDAAGVDVSVALGFAWQSADLCRRHSDYLLESAARFPGRIVPFPIAGPTDAQSFMAEVARWGPAARGIGELRPQDQGFTLDSPSGDLLAGAARGGRPLLFHVSEPVGHQYPGKSGLGLEEFYRYMSRHRDISVVGAHWAGGLPLYAHMPEVRSMFQSNYVDTAASALLYHPSIFVAVVKLIGAGRILFGSDFPLLSQQSQLEAIERIEVTETQRRQILGENAVALLDLPRTSARRTAGAER
jgi:predicted TIM-barrel fold metal-dependent hydrolase